MRSIVATLLVIVLGYFLLIVVVEVPPFGGEDIPIHNYVKERYISQGVEETGSVNIVTSIITDYRSFDTFGEIAVLFGAIIGAVAVLESKGLKPTVDMNGRNKRGGSNR